MIRKVQFTLLLFIVMALCTACGQAGGRPTPPDAGIANPASENCLRQGGEPTLPPAFELEYRVVQGGDGQFRVLDMPVYVP
jgi:hypothetical protein